MEDGVIGSPEESLFEGEGEFSEEDEELLETLCGEQIRGIHTIRQKNRVSIGMPISLPLTQLFLRQGQGIPVDIQLQVHDFEFYQIQLACSFEAGTNYRFHEARFQLVLETQTALGSAMMPPAIAYDLFPLQLDDQRQVRVKRSLNPEIKFSFDPLSGSLSVPLYERDEEFIHYKSRVKAFDLQGTQPAWSFARTSSHEIDGPQKLFMIVRKPKGTQVYASFKVTASVEYALGSGVLGPFSLLFFFRRRNSSSTRTESPNYPLC